MSRDILFSKYFESFNFYFSKHINEILADLAIPHVILYKDYLYYDDEEEYLRRFYRLDETIARIPNLSKFYENVGGTMNKPNLAVHDQHGIILKRNNKLNELIANRFKNPESVPKTQRDHEKPITFRVLPKTEDNDTGYYEECSESYVAKKVKMEKDMLIQDGKHHDSFQKMMDHNHNQEDDEDQVSYESQEHDVYNPSPVSSSVSLLGIKKKKNVNNNNKASHQVSGNKTEVLEAELLEGSLSAIGKTERRESRDSIMFESRFEENSELCMSNVSDMSLIEHMLGGPLDSEAKGGLVKDVEKMQKKVNNNNKVPVEKKTGPPSKKKISEVDNHQQEDVKKANSTVNKSSAPRSNSAIEEKDKDKEKPVKNVIEPIENKRVMLTGNSDAVATTRGPVAMARRYVKPETLHTDVSEKIKTEEDSSAAKLQKPKNEKSVGGVLNTEMTSASTGPLQPLETPKKVDYWAISHTHAKTNTPAKGLKVNNKSDPEVQSTSAGKIRPQKLRRSAQNSTNKQQIPTAFQSPEVKTQEKYYEQLRAINHPERLIKTAKEVFLKQSGNSTDRSKNESKRKSRHLNEDKVDSYYKEEKKQANSRLEKSAHLNGLYSDHQLYLSSLNSHSKMNGSKSRTEDKTSFLKSRTEDNIQGQVQAQGQGPQKSFTDLPHHAPASHSSRTRIVSSLKVLTSFTDNQQKSARLESSSREGGSLGHILSTTAYNFKTQNSVEHAKSLRVNLSEERQSGSVSNRVPKTVSLRNLHNTMKPQGKSLVPNTLANKYEAYDYSSVLARRSLIQTASSIPSMSGGKVHSVANPPISPRKHLNLNINLKKLSQDAQQSKQHDSGIDNSYGFWTSRSSKGNVNESSKKIKESPKLRSERTLYTEGRDYGHPGRYGNGSLTEKPSVLNSRRLTKVSMYHEFKVRENEMLRSIKNLKPDYLMAMWPPGSAEKISTDKQETKKRLASSGKRLSGSRIVKGKKKVEGKL